MGIKKEGLDLDGRVAVQARKEDGKEKKNNPQKLRNWGKRAIETRKKEGRKKKKWRKPWTNLPEIHESFPL